MMAVSTRQRADRIRVLESLIARADQARDRPEYVPYQHTDHSAPRADYVGYLSYASPADFADALQRRGQPARDRVPRSARRPEQEAEPTEQEPEKAGTSTCLAELARLIAGGRLDPPRFARISRLLEVRAYELRPNDALRALALISEGARQLQVAGHEYAKACPGEAQRGVMAADRAVEVARASAQGIMASVSSQFQQGLWEKGLHSAGQGGTARLCADALMAMALTQTGRQEQLDALLSQLLILLHREPHVFTPPVLATIAVALGRAWRDGGVNGCALSAHAGTDDFHTRANLRFLLAFNDRLVQGLPGFQGQEITDVMEFYAAPYLEETHWGRCFQHAAALPPLGSPTGPNTLEP